MALYEIIKTPGKDRVYPNEGDTPIRNQDEAKVVLARLRAEARAEGETCDFVVKRLDAAERTGSTAQGTSIRLTEENRRKVAKHCGRLMMETGDAVSMGDAVARLVDLADAVTDLLTDGRLDDDKVIAYAKSLIKARKQAEAA